MPKISRRHALWAGLALAGVARAMPAAAATESTLRRLAQAGTLRCAVDDSLTLLVSPPGSRAPVAEDPFGQAMARLMAEGLGLRPSLVEGPRQGDALDWLIAGRADVATLPVYSRTNLRRAMFSHIQVELDLVLFGPGPQRLRRARDLAGRRIGLLHDHEAALNGRDSGPLVGLPTLSLETLAELEAALLKGRADLVLLAAHQARNLLARNPNAGLMLHFSPTTLLYAPAVRLGEHDLLNAVDQVLAVARADGRLGQLRERLLGHGQMQLGQAVP